MTLNHNFGYFSGVGGIAPNGYGLAKLPYSKCQIEKQMINFSTNVQ